MKSIAEFMEKYDLSPKSLLTELDAYMSSDEIKEFINHCKRMFDLDE